MAADSTIVKVSDAACVPIGLAIVLAVLGIASHYVIPEAPVVDAIFLIVRIALAVAAGWLVVRRAGLPLWHAAMAGAVLMFADHVVVKSVWFLVTNELMAVGGVLLSYVMFFWVAMLLSFAGGVAAKFTANGRAAI